VLASAEEQATAAWQLFNRHFFVRVQNQFLYNDNFLRNKGIVSHTPEEAKREMLSKRLTCLSIKEMVILRMEGADIDLTEVKDATIIYDLVVEHLREWAEITRLMIYDTIPPAEEFYILDEIASELHPYVVRTKMRELNAGVDQRNLGQAFLGSGRVDQAFTLQQASSYKNLAPIIINRASAYYGAQEFRT
jgi:hypothetical protein